MWKKNAAESKVAQAEDHYKKNLRKKAFKALEKARSDAEEKAARATDHYNNHLKQNLQKKAFKALEKARSDAEEKAARATDHYNKNMQKNTLEMWKKNAAESKVAQAEEESWEAQAEEERQRQKKEKEEREKTRCSVPETDVYGQNKCTYKELEATKIEEREELSSIPSDLSPSAWIVQTLTDKIYDYLHALYLKNKEEKYTIGQMANQYTQQILNVHGLSSEESIQIAKEIATETQDLEKRSVNLFTISEQYKS